MRKRKRREKQTKEKHQTDETQNSKEEIDSTSSEFMREVRDEFSPKEPLRTSHKIHSFAFPSHTSSLSSNISPSIKDADLSVEVFITHNKIILFQIELQMNEKESTRYLSF
jgi:hypothetical protein